MNPRFIHLYKNICYFIGGGGEKRLERFNSFLIYAALLILTLLLFQPTLAKEARRDTSLVNQVGQRILADSELPIIESHLYALQQQTVELEKFSGWGGAIEPLGDKLLLVTPRGRIALIHGDGEVVYLEEKVPMNESALESIGLRDKDLAVFRVADILLHEQLPDKFRLFVLHHYFVGDCVEFRISSTLLHLDTERAMTLGPWKTEFRANPCITVSPEIGFHGVHMAGGRMLMDGAEHLLVVIGGHTLNPWKTIDDPDSHLGTLVRIELTSGGADILARGLRNPQGFARDADGTLWAAEHGPQGGDELNILRAGAHYGWPYVTHGIEYGNKIWPHSKVQGRHDGFKMPAFAWVPAIAPSNIIVSDSQLFPLWQNDLLIASLKTESIFRVRLHEKRVVYVERIEIGSRIRDMTQMSDGRIALLFDNAKIQFLQRAPVYCQYESSGEAASPTGSIAFVGMDSIYSHDAHDVCIDIFRIIEEAGDPIIRSNYDVYIHESQLIYVKSPCSEDDIEHRFFLHITPVHVNDLPEERKQHGVDHLDFSYNDYGVPVGENCIVMRVLPQYDIKHIATGQIMRVESPSGELSWARVWRGEHDVIDIFRIIEDAGDPIIRSNYDVYIHESRLLYVKGSPCSEDDIEHRFFLHITPVYMKDLPEERKQYGFDNLDFLYNDYDVPVGENCIVMRDLPQYDIKHIATGQTMRVESPSGEVSWAPVWRGEHTIDQPSPAAPWEREDRPSMQTDDRQGELSGAALFAARCGSCHNLVTEHTIGPHLVGVIGRRAGRVAGYNTSAALTSLNIVWTREKLAEFLVNPSQFAPGTSMSDMDITEEEARIIADFLGSTK